MNCEIEIYNAISINDNFQNNYMVIENVELYPDNILNIYNRNGELVYSQDNYGQEETKLFYGIANKGSTVNRRSYLPSGSYMYVFTYLNQYTGFTITKKGFLTISNLIGN